MTSPPALLGFIEKPLARGKHLMPDATVLVLRAEDNSFQRHMGCRGAPICDALLNATPNPLRKKHNN
jgi:hypothetical protein